MKHASTLVLEQFIFFFPCQTTPTTHNHPLMTVTSSHATVIVAKGTPYDLSSGLQAGFGGSPDRYGGCASSDSNCSDVGYGAWERPIGLYRTSDTVVVQVRLC